MKGRSSGELRVGPDADPDRYVLGAAVGSGAEALLYRGSITTATGLEFAVAIKMLQPRFLPHVEEWHARWSEQVELLRSLQVPGVVRVRDGFLGPLPHAAGDAGESRTLYLVMNWVEGESLDEWVRRRPDRDPFDTLKLLLGVAAALDMMHSGIATGGIPVVHRDVKPSNILVTDSGTVLVDFGLTRGLPEGQRLSGVTGTPGYLAPEATTAGVYTPATDRYAFGGVAFFVLTGSEPPTTHDLVELRRALASVSALTDRPDVIDHVMTMLDADPTARPSVLANWIGQLRRSSLTSLPEILAPQAPRRHPGIPQESGQTARRRSKGLRIAVVQRPEGTIGPADPVSSVRVRQLVLGKSAPGAVARVLVLAVLAFAALLGGRAGVTRDTASLVASSGSTTVASPSAPTVAIQQTAVAPPDTRRRPMTTETVDYERPGAPPQVPEGVTVVVELATTTLRPGQPVQARVRLRNATDKKFYIFVGCGVTFVEVINPAGELVGGSNDEPCGTAGHYFSNETVSPGADVERSFPIKVDSARPGPHEVRAAWARDTGAGTIYYIASAPVPVQVRTATP